MKWQAFDKWPETLLITKRRSNMKLIDPTEMNHEQKRRPSVAKSGLLPKDWPAEFKAEEFKR